MADLVEPIVTPDQLPSVPGIPTLTDEIIVQRTGSGIPDGEKTCKAAFQQVVSLFNGPGIKNVIYVNELTGEDISGIQSGSINYPYKTYEFAVSTISDASNVNPYTIIIAGGSLNSTGTPVLKPFVSIKGETQGTIFNNTNPLVFDSSWGTIPTQGLNSIQDLTIANINLDGNVFSNSPALPFISLINVYVSGSANFNTNANFQYELYSLNNFFSNCIINNIDIFAAATTFESLKLGNLSWVNIGSSVNLLSNKITELEITAPSTLSSVPYFKFLSTELIGPVTFTGSKCIPKMDADSIISGITLNDGASIEKITGAENIDANYPSPTNYTPTNNSVKGHLEGINAAFGSIAPSDGLHIIDYWNASTNTPTLTSSIGTKGDIYIVSVPGNTLLNTYGDWQLGDFAIFNGTDWQRLRANNIFPTKNIRYISQYGSDTSGDGSILYPFQTLSQLYSVVTDNTSVNQYTAIMTGTITDPNLIRCKPFIHLKGETQGCVLNNATPLEFDPTFDTLNGVIYIQDLIVNDIDFDSSSFTTPSTGGWIQFNNVYSGGEVSIQGGATCNFGFYNYTSYLTTCNLHNIYVVSLANTYLNFNLGNGAYANAIVALNSTGDNIYSISLTAPSTLSFTPSFSIKSDILGAQTYDGGKCNVKLDVASYKSGAALTNGATIELISIADGLNANYASPTNYTPVNGTVKGHLEGINAALATSSSSTPSKLVYVSQFGSDSPGTGDGTYNKPYATLSFAYSQITTNAAINIFTVIIDGVINETSLTFKPYINLKGYNGNGYINNSGAFTLHSSWGTVTDNQSLSIQDLRINSLNFDTSSFTNNLITTLRLINSQIDGNYNTNGSSTNYFYLSLYNSFVVNLTAPNTGVSIYESTIFAGLTIDGSYANTHTALFVSGGNINDINLTADTSVPFIPVFDIKGANITGDITLDGEKCVLIIDVATYKTPTLTNGAIISPININVSNISPLPDQNLLIGNTSSILQVVLQNSYGFFMVADGGYVQSSLPIVLQNAGDGLDHYTQDNGLVTNFTGPSTISGVQIKCSRLNNIVFLEFPAISDIAGANASMTSSAALAAEFRPSTNMNDVKKGTNSNLDTTVWIKVNTTGIIEISGSNTLNTFGNFQAGQQYGIEPCVITYKI